MHDYSFVHDRVRKLTTDFHEIAQKYGRRPEEVTLMAVTKTHPWVAVEAAIQAGVTQIGENRVQEMLERFPSTWDYPGVTLSFIGHLQKNKVKKAVPLVQAIQSIDDQKTLELINKEAQLANKVVDVWFEVNTSGEEAKSGVRNLGGLLDLYETSLGLDAIRLVGLMTIGPLGSDMVRIAKSFGDLRTMGEYLRSQGASSCLGLSMGMSDDWPVAIAEGSTMIRIGTALFGQRT